MDNEIDSAASGNRRQPKPDMVSIGNRQLRPATLMMRHGFDQSLSEGALKPRIFLTSTFVFESAASGKRHFEGVTGKPPGGAEGLIYLESPANPTKHWSTWRPCAPPAMTHLSVPDARKRALEAI